MRRLLPRIDPLLILVFLLSLPALAPLFAPGYFYEAHDGRHSVFYQIMFDASVRDGALWPRWAMHHLQGYGYPTFIILAPLGFWLGELFVLMGAGFTTAARFAWATGVLLSAWGMYRLLLWWLVEQPGASASDRGAGSAPHRREVALHMAAAAGAILYVYLPYRLADIYVRGALNESLLFLWLPWVLLAWDRMLIFTGPGRNMRWALATLALAGMWLTHSFAVLSLTPLLILWVLFRLIQKAAEEIRAGRNGLEEGAVSPLRALLMRTGLAASAGVGALALSAVFLVPLLVESPLLDQQVYVSDTYNYQNHFVQIGQYFSPYWGYGYSDDPQGANDGMGFQVGVAVLTLALAALVVPGRVAHGLRSVTAMLVLAAVALLLFMSPLAQGVWDAIPTLSVIQFPWRLLVAAGFVVCALGGLLLGQLAGAAPGYAGGLAEAAGAGSGLLFFGLLALAGSAGYASPALQPIEPWREDGRAVYRFEEQFPDMIVGTIWTSQVFTQSPMSAGYADPAYTEIHGRTETLERLTILSGAGTVLRNESAGSTFGGVVRMDQPGIVRINVLDFPGWRVTIDGEPASYRRSGPIGLLEVDLPVGEHTLAARMGSTPPRVVGSLLSWSMLAIVLAVMFLPQIRRGRLPAPPMTATESPESTG